MTRPFRLRRLSTWALALAAPMSFIGLFIDQTAAQAATTSQGRPIADSYVLSSQPSANYGTSTTLQSRVSGPVARSYLRFNLPLTGRVTKATLQLYARSSSTLGLEVRAVQGPWEELTLNFSNAPAVGPVGATSGPVTSGKWISIDVTPLVTTGLVNLALTTPSSTTVSVGSREFTQKPLLTVTTTATYYVNVDSGKDSNDGTSPARPWQSLAKVASAPLAPGDAVRFNRGNSWIGPLTIRQNGSQALPIIFGSYGTGNLPIIQGADTCVLIDGSYINLAELQLQACKWAGVEFYGSNNRVEKSVIRDNAAGLVVTAGSAANSIVNNDIRDNNRMSVLTPTPNNDDSGAFGVLILGDDNEVAYNTISGSRAFSYDYGTDGAAVEIYGGQRNHIHRNRSSQNDSFGEMGNSRSADNTFAYNSAVSSFDNSLFFVTRGAADTFGPVLRTNLYNNSTSLPGVSSQGFVCYAGCTSEILTMKNNIVRAAGKVGYADGPFVQQSNIYWLGLIQFVTDPTSILDPLYVNISTGDLRLTALSPAIDRGTGLSYSRDLDGRPVPIDGNSDGVAVPDIGAFEYGP